MNDHDACASMNCYALPIMKINSSQEKQLLSLLHFLIKRASANISKICRRCYYFSDNQFAGEITHVFNMFNSNIAILFLLYFLQGIPYGIQGRFLPIYLRQHGVNLTNISFMKLLFIPWICKALWALMFDEIKSKRCWLLSSMTGMAFFCGCLSCIDPTNIILITVIFLAMNVCASSQDIAVDGLAIQILTYTQLADGNVAQVVGYKVGSVIGGGVLILLSSIMTWSQLFVFLFVLYVSGIYVISVTMPQFSFYPNTEVPIGQDSSVSMVAQLTETGQESTTLSSMTEQASVMVLTWRQKLMELIQTPGTTWIIKFVLIYKLGEQACVSMLPLFLVDKQMSTTMVGLWVGVMSDSVSIGGSVLAGWLISTHRAETLPLVRGLCKLRVVPIVLSALIVLLWQDVYESIHYHLTVACIATMCALLLVSGMLTTSTFTLMMQCSQRAPLHSQATHYALVTTLEVFGKLTFSVCSGYIVDSLGYMASFLLFAVLSALVMPLLDSPPPVLCAQQRSD